jgi:5-oxoprolinase (ATP-hydrolysing)
LLKQGDSFLINSPYHGGTHLPDLTVISPVFDQKTSKELLFFVASRGHHADIGGISPGSMPANSTHISEEGVLFDNMLLVENEKLRSGALINKLSNCEYPSRNVAQNVADLKAQLAANKKGIDELNKMIERYGLDVVQAYMGHVQDAAEYSVRQAIKTLNDGEFSYQFDQGALVHVKITIDQLLGEAIVDFSGTSSVQATNFNAPLSVTKAAVLYVFRTLVADDIPLNSGCLRPVTLIVPENSMLNPQYPAAVVAGNVETSQVVTDALYGALNMMAAAQGTMNNLTIGNAQYQYYETICGGSGAGPSFNGCDAVQTHMTNSRLTDPEVLESRFPLRLTRFAIRKNSGGKGRYRGGNGVVRELEFTQPMSASILSNRRVIAPFGADGGDNGQLGENYVIRASGQTETLMSCDSVSMAIGDKFVIKTPGGGGFGAIDHDS